MNSVSPSPTSIAPGTPVVPETSRKRARPTKSCLECRRKKLKCDRTQPCMQCKKLAREALCIYVGRLDDTLNEGMYGDGESSNKRPRVEVSRLASWAERDHMDPQTESLGLLSERSHITARQPRPDNDENLPVPPGKIYLHGPRSKYVGLGNRMALMDHVSCLLY